MYVTESVNIPEELERQLKRDRLVLFVGAGIRSSDFQVFRTRCRTSWAERPLVPCQKDADRLTIS